MKDDNGTYRLVFELPIGFVVYKAFKFNDLWTVKYWCGASLDSVALRWRTNVPFTPDEWMIERARERIRATTLRLADLPLRGRR